MVLLPTFPILRAGESHYREKTKFPKLAETSSFLRIRSYPASFLSETPNYKRNGSSVGVRSFVKLASRSDPIAGATAARGIRAAPPIHRTVTVARTVASVPSQADTQLSPMGVAWSTNALIACSLRIRSQDSRPSHGLIVLRCPGSGRFPPMSTPLIS